MEASDTAGRIAAALGRIEAASARIEATASTAGAVVDTGEPQLQVRYDALRQEARAALDQIDALLSGLEA
ncbi:hypothetical protein GRI62_07040 [Erythrobacter arachoides]|uniref:Uncharacterized protein n=1 Tax=Aurantiacibacter arachoides TaxID=1850444 RepID=A0A845A1C0_9SPHN|nr:hypothetical protein [Aurantiacibacter arachoides]MXO93360.1 hypothetical protein [Aurantiacibacter arachoides]GGD49982.1 hypothetical protein GCM10011411_07220 [Aurantiacibacter arachoides]